MQALSDAELRAKTDEFRARLGRDRPGPHLRPDLLPGPPRRGRGRRRGRVRAQGGRRARRRAPARPRRAAARGLRGGARGGPAHARDAPLRRAAHRRHRAAPGQDRRDAHRRGQDARRHPGAVPQRARGTGAHLVTVNDYLARRDAGWNAPALPRARDERRGDRARPGRQPRLRLHLRPRVPRRDPPGRAPAAPASLHAARGLRRRHHLRHQQRVRLRLPARQHGAVARPLRAARPQLRHRRRGRHHPDRRGAHAADHQRPGQRAHREVLHVRAARPPAGRRGRLHRRREDEVRRAHRGGHRQDGEVDGHREHLRARARRRGPPDRPGAQGARALPARPRLHRQATAR